MSELYTCYDCYKWDCNGQVNKTCHDARWCFTMHVTEAGSDEPLLTKGCVYQSQDHRIKCGTKRHSKKNQTIPSGRYASDCCVGNLCNNQTMIDFTSVRLNITNQGPGDNVGTGDSPLVISMLVVAIVALFSVFVAFTRRRHHYQQANQTEKPEGIEVYSDKETPYNDGIEIRAMQAGDSTLRECFGGHEMTSGSGSGMPLLIQRSLSKDIQLRECIGKGRYGEVWRASWHEEDVAVKRFFSHEEKSWRRETEIYNTSMMRHDNILAYLGSDVTSVDSCTQFWLVSQYHPMGSLYDFLCIRAITVRQALQILSSAVGGLLHLHTEMHGTTGKPAIAHRDIKAKNILMKSPTVACICDFGLAISQDSTGDLRGPLHADLSGDQVGTKRYMAPEILDRKLDLKLNNSIESLKSADIYSFALVMWETLCRSFIEGNGSPTTGVDKDTADQGAQEAVEDVKAGAGYDDYKAPYYDEYKVPYYDVVPSDPSFEDMRKVVVIDQYRPQFRPRFQTNETLIQVAELIRECWNHNPAARLPALRIKKTLNRLIKDCPEYSD